MKLLKNILLVVITVEVIVCGFFIVRQMQRVSPPAVNLLRLDPVTAAELEELRRQAMNGTPREWKELAEAYLGNGYYVAAEQCFHHVVAVNPSDIRAWYGQGFCLERIGRTTEAIEVLTETATNADAQLAQTCWYQIGRCFLREEQSESAEAAFRRIPDFQPAVYQLAKLLIRSDRAKEAIPLLEQQLVDLPNSLKLIQLRMHAAEAVGDAQLAAELRAREDRAEYQLVLEYGQSFISMFSVRYGLAKILSRAMRLRTQGTLKQRKTALDEALSIILPHRLWQFRSVLMAAAHVELGLGNLSVAKTLLADVRQNTQDGVDVRDLAALLADAAGDRVTAWQLWEQACLMKPSVELHNLLADDAAPGSQQTKNEHRGQALLLTGLAAWRRNDIDEAQSQITEALELLPTDVRALYYLGEILRLQGDVDGARTAWQECLRWNPDHSRAAAGLNHFEK